DGVKAIWEVIRRIGAREGDRIGHGLALADDPDRFARLHAGAPSIPQGDALDTLVWLHRRLGAIPGIDNRAVRVVEDEVYGLSREVYRHAHQIQHLQHVQQL